MKYVTHVGRSYPKPVVAVFDLATDPAKLADIFVGYGPVAPVVRTEMEGGAPYAVGNTLRVFNGDGTQVTQPILALERPHTHRYKLVGPFKAPFSWIVREGESDWRFSAEGEAACRIDWTYRFELTSPAMLPLAAIVVGVLFRGAMARCLETLEARLNV